MSDKAPHPVHEWRRAIRAPRELQGLAGIGPTTRTVAQAVSTYMGPTGEAYPGAERLAVDTDLSLRAVKQHLPILRDLGWMVLLEQGGREGGRRATRWRCVVPPIDTLVEHLTGAAPALVDVVTSAPPAPVTSAARAPAPTPTSAPHDATSAPPYVTSATAAPQLEELVEQGGRERLVSVAASMVTAHRDEIRDLVEQMLVGSSPDFVDQALRKLAAQGATFRFPSQLRTSVAAAHKAASDHRRRAIDECPDCLGRGIVPADSEETSYRSCTHAALRSPAG